MSRNETMMEKSEDDYELDTSEEKMTFASGAQREVKTGKGRFDLLPPFALHKLAIHYEKGGIEHGDRNWEDGIPVHSFVDSAFRHIIQYMKGETFEPHLVAALWNIIGAVETEERIKLGILPKELNDMPLYLKKLKEKEAYEAEYEAMGKALDAHEELIKAKGFQDENSM